MYITFLSAEVVQPPADKVVCAGDNATFTCCVNAPHATWKINRLYLTELAPAVRHDIDWDTGERNTHILIILAKPEYNNTEVQCVAIMGLERNVTGTAYLFIG